jgi:pantoate kinase
MRAFCPGHVTGFFSIEDSGSNTLERGSRGAGFCIDRGAIADVDVTEGSGSVHINLNGKGAEVPVTRSAVRRLLPCDKDVKINIKLSMPVGQGFGMSAAGTFAACLALATQMGENEPHRKALEATHTAEVEHRTGLGDAVAQSLGGFVIREAPGIPPHGKVHNFQMPYDEVVLCVLGEGVSTPEIIADDGKRRAILKVGRRCMEDINVDHGPDDFVGLSKRFATESGLMTGLMDRALATIEDFGEGSMVMLGNAIFAFGNVGALEESLKPFGRVVACGISKTGARVID